MAKFRTKNLILIAAASLAYWIALPLLAMAFTIGLIPGDCFGCETLRNADFTHFHWSLAAIFAVYMIGLGVALRSRALGLFQ